MKCRLCNEPGELTSARFQQLYPQNNDQSAVLDWWECRVCGGWFVYPVPPPEVISKYWQTVSYNQEVHKDEIGEDKLPLMQRIFDLLPSPSSANRLLDVGSNFGVFLEQARDAGWQTAGFEPNTQAVEFTRSRGFEVRSGWMLEDANFTPNSFDAIITIDAFCYVWHPYATLETMYSLLSPGGVLVMRLTNKQFILRLVRRLTRPGDKRNAILSRLLQAQFHTVQMQSLARICQRIGFSETHVYPNALTAPMHQLERSGQAMYRIARLLYLATLRHVQLSPGVLFVAYKE